MEEQRKFYIVFVLKKSMETQVLEDIGLGNSEIKVYLALLELGTATAGPLLEKTGLQSSVLHMTLNKLIDKGLISFVKEGRINHYQASNPENIVQYIDDKKERFQKILPELLAKQQNVQSKPEITTFRDIRGIKTLLYELLNAGGQNHHTFGSTRDSLMLGESWWVNYHKKRADRKIKAKLLFNESLKSWTAETKYPLSKVKYTKEGFEPLTETIVRNDKVGIIMWTEKPLGVLIHHKVVADSYDKFFQVIWGTGK